MFSPLLQLETIWKPQRMQEVVGISNKVSCQELIMLLQTFYGMAQAEFSEFQWNSCCMMVLTWKEANSALTYQGQRCFCQGPNRDSCIVYQRRVQLWCPVAWATPRHCETGWGNCTGAAAPPAQPFLAVLLHMCSNGYLNPSAFLQQDISLSQAYPYLKGFSLLKLYQKKLLDKNKSWNHDSVVLSAFNSLLAIHHWNPGKRSRYVNKMVFFVSIILMYDWLHRALKGDEYKWKNKVVGKL